MRMSSSRLSSTMPEAADAFQISFRPHQDDGILNRSHPTNAGDRCRRCRAGGDGLRSSLAVISPHVMPLRAAVIHGAITSSNPNVFHLS